MVKTELAKKQRKFWRIRTSVVTSKFSGKKIGELKSICIGNVMEIVKTVKNLLLFTKSTKVVLLLMFSYCMVW